MHHVSQEKNYGSFTTAVLSNLDFLGAGMGNAFRLPSANRSRRNTDIPRRAARTICLFADHGACGYPGIRAGSRHKNGVAEAEAIHRFTLKRHPAPQQKPRLLLRGFFISPFIFATRLVRARHPTPVGKPNTAEHRQLSYRL